MVSRSRHSAPPPPTIPEQGEVGDVNIRALVGGATVHNGTKTSGPSRTLSDAAVARAINPVLATHPACPDFSAPPPACFPGSRRLSPGVSSPGVRSTGPGLTAWSRGGGGGAEKAEGAAERERLRKLVSAAAGAATSSHPACPGLCRFEPLPASLSSQASRDPAAAASLTGGGRFSARCSSRRRERGTSRGQVTRPGAGTEAATCGR